MVGECLPRRQRTHQKAAHRSSRIIFTAANVLHRVLKIDVFSFLTNDVRTVMTHVSLEHISQEYFKRGQEFFVIKKGKFTNFPPNAGDHHTRGKGKISRRKNFSDEF